MKNLSIGTPVIVWSIANTAYQDDGHKVVERTPVVLLHAVIVGQVVKRLGIYNRGSRGGYFEDDFEEASLSVTGSVTLWLVRTGMTNKPLMVHDDDLEVTTDQFTIPHRASKPNVKDVCNSDQR